MFMTINKKVNFSKNAVDSLREYDIYLKSVPMGYGNFSD